MSARVQKLAEWRALTVDEADKIERRLNQMAADFAPLGPMLESLRHHVKARTERAAYWRFVMLGPSENRAVLNLIADEAKRPKISTRLWGAMLESLHPDNGRIQMTRREMQDAAGTASSSCISDALAEFVAWKAVIRAVDGREVRFFLNPQIATHLGEHVRPGQQARHDGVVSLAEARELRQAAEKARAARKDARAAKARAKAEAEAAGKVNDRRQVELLPDVG